MDEFVAFILMFTKDEATGAELDVLEQTGRKMMARLRLAFGAKFGECSTLHTLSACQPHAIRAVRCIQACI